MNEPSNADTTDASQSEAHCGGERESEKNEAGRRLTYILIITVQT